VRVRVLLDDMDARRKNLALAALAAHPRIAVRLFNPFASRRGTLGMVGEMVGSFARINRRMHNKSWIADNRFALVGGRNVGDEYFGASEQVNFHDLDVALAGPAVAAVSDSFDAYWNSAVVWPIASLGPDPADPAALARLRTRAAALQVEADGNAWVRAMRAVDPRAGARASLAAMHWTADWRLLVDAPDKSLGDEARPASSPVLDGLVRALEAAERDVVLISPYFVPGEKGTERLVAFARSGRTLRILTNSLAANDVAAVHAGYARYRDDLLAGGVQLWELRPEGRAPGISLFGSSGASLHTKAAVFDGRTAFVGSFNLDPRSVTLNCEQGLLIAEPALVAELEALFVAMLAPTVSWQVGRDGTGRLQWSDGIRTWDREPEATFGRRVSVGLARLLPIEPLL
jgi:putative cardiolipin synthase